MLNKLLISWAGIIIGVFFGYFIFYKTNFLQTIPLVSSIVPSAQKETLGFLPFWLIDKAQNDYSPYINTLNYFNLTIDSDGTILKYTQPGEADPGWHALSSGKVDSFLQNAKNKGMSLSLTVFSSNDDAINTMLSDPEKSGVNLINDVAPIMKQYNFSDLNLDVEQVAEASSSARQQFSKFVETIKNGLKSQNAGTLSIDISPIAFVKNTNLVDPLSIVPNVDRVILMAYDYHNPGSLVTGPVSPETGAGIVSEFDTESAVASALAIIPPYKLILGIPLYGYQWESIGNVPRSATIPGTSIITSSKTAELFLSNCASCSAEFDKTDQENHVIYKDQETGTFHQLFFPDIKSTQAKVDFAKQNNLGGMAVWALGYEDSTILQPLSEFYH